MPASLPITFNGNIKIATIDVTSGIAVPDEAIDNAVKYVQSMTSPDGSVGYSGIGGSSSTNLPAIATLIYAIAKRKDTDEYQATAGFIKKRLEQNENSWPYYNRYYMAQALYQSDYEAWEKWNRLTTDRLRGMQTEEGSIGNSSHGQAYSTAMSLLALALNFRFLPIYER